MFDNARVTFFRILIVGCFFGAWRWIGEDLFIGIVESTGGSADWGVFSLGYIGVLLIGWIVAVLVIRKGKS